VEYDKGIPELWGIQGEVPLEGNPQLCKLTPAFFAPNNSFFGTEVEEFDSHVTGLSSVMLRDFDNNTHQVVNKLDEGPREIQSLVTVFLPLAVDRTILDIGEGLSIAEVACAIMPLLQKKQSTSYNRALY